MNTNEDKINKLTRDLMQGTAEQPSASLMSRIMNSIMREKNVVRKAYIKKMPSLTWLLGGLFVYLLVVAGILFSFKFNAENKIEITPMFWDIFPLILTITGGISCFFFFSQLDNWLRKKEHKNE